MEPGTFAIAYLSNTLRVLCPVIFIAMGPGTPALSRFLTAVHRRTARLL